MAYCTKCGAEVPAGAAYCPSCGTPTQAASSAAPSASVSGFDALTKDQKAQEYWVERLVAFVVDAIIVNIVLLILFAIVTIPFLLTGVLGLGFLWGPYPVLSGLVLVFYFAVMESTSGASFGKRIFRLKVVSRTGSLPNFGEAFIRNLSKIYWLLLLLDVIVGLAVSKGYQQKYSDQMMGTSVVRA